MIFFALLKRKDALDLVFCLQKKARKAVAGFAHHKEY